MIDVNYNEYKETIAQNMKLIVENHDLKEEIERLNNIIGKAIYMIEDLMANNLEVHKGEPIIKVLKGE